jgi:two-component sensor histidine kinase
MTEPNASVEAERLLLELQHRVKNIAAVVRSLVRRTAQTSRDLEDFQVRFDGRLGALVRAHAAMARTAHSGLDLQELISDTLQENAPASKQWRVAGPDVRLNARVAETLALLIHELAVEAVARGSLLAVPGELAVTWTVPTDGRALMLEWRESGLASRVPPEDFELGRELLDRALPYQFGARTSLEVEADGLRCNVELPLGGSGE